MYFHTTLPFFRWICSIAEPRSHGFVWTFHVLGWIYHNRFTSQTLLRSAGAKTSPAINQKSFAMYLFRGPACHFSRDFS